MSLTFYKFVATWQALTNRRKKMIGSPHAGWFSAQPLFQVIDRETGGDYKN